MQGVVHREREKRALLRECLLEQVEHPPVGFSDRVRRYLRISPLGKGGCFAVFPNLALSGVPTAPLDDKLAEERISEENILGFGHVLRGIRLVVVHPAAQHILHLVEVRPQVVHPDRACEVGLVATRE